MNTVLGSFTVKTYSMVAPSQDSLQRMQAVINEAAKHPLKVARSCTNSSFNTIDIALEYINERELEHQLFLVNGTNERLCLNLKKREIEFTGW